METDAAGKECLTIYFPANQIAVKRRQASRIAVDAAFDERYPRRYWSKLEAEQAYPTEFIAELTQVSRFADPRGI